jgi:hypothetical protein
VQDEGVVKVISIEPEVPGAIEEAVEPFWEKEQLADEVPQVTVLPETDAPGVVDPTTVRPLGTTT